MADIILGAVNISLAFMPKNSYYFGEGLFGIRVMPYWIFECAQVAVGAFLIKEGVLSLV